jgi:fatty-acyl-CoA synthase
MTAPDISLGNWFFQRSRQTPNRSALTFEGTTWTYAQMQDSIDRLAAALKAGGVCKGDRVAFIGFNQPAYFELLFAASRLGAIFVPLNFRLSGPELEYIINDAGVHTLVAGSDHRGVIDSIRSNICIRNALSADVDAVGWPSLNTFTSGVSPLEQAAPIGPDEVAVIMYTSGTTGLPKGAMLTHDNIWWCNSMAVLTSDTLEDDVVLLVAPLFHIGGLNCLALLAFQKGAHVILHRGFDPARWLEAVTNSKVTTTFAVPAMLLAVSRHPTFASADLSSVRTIACGGAPVPEPLLKLYGGRGIQVNQGYGLTETAPLVTYLTNEWSTKKLGSAGRPGMFGEVVLQAADGHFLSEPGARGEVLYKGPNVMKGYWNKPEATAAAIDSSGWFHTGDVGYFDADGFLYICDRVKDMIISGGENIYPAEVEATLYAHPSIAEVAVIGQPDERWGEVVVAVAVLRSGASLDLEQLRVWGTERLARYKLPSRLEVIDALPRNPAGKVLKFELRARFVRKKDTACVA